VRAADLLITEVHWQSETQHAASLRAGLLAEGFEVADVRGFAAVEVARPISRAYFTREQALLSDRWSVHCFDSSSGNETAEDAEDAEVSFLFYTQTSRG